MASGASGNIFAALTKTKSKKKPREEPKEPEVDKHAELEQAIFSAPSGTGLSNWADESEEEDEWEGAHAHAGHHEEGWEAVSGLGAAHRC